MTYLGEKYVWNRWPTHKQAPAVWGISFRYGTVRYFCKIPVYRYFSVRYKPYIFIPGFFGNCLKIFVFYLLVPLVINLENFQNCLAGHLRRHMKTHTREKLKNATNVTLLPLGQAIWGHTWKRTVEKCQTNATNVTLHPLRQAFWRNTWKRTVGRSQTNVTNVTLHPLRQAIWGDTWNLTMEKSQTNATNVTLHLLGQEIWGHTCYKKIPKNTGILFSKILVSVFESSPGIPVFSVYRRDLAIWE